MSTVTWLGLDTALSAFGFAAMYQPPGGAPTVSELGVWKTAPDRRAPGKFADHARRIDELAEQLLDLVDRVQPAVAFVESLAFVPRSGFLSSSSLGRVRGLVDGICRARSVPLHEYGPQVIKRGICGAPDAEKRQVAATLRRLYPLVRGELDENATDALAVAHLGALSEAMRWHLGRGAT